MIWRAPVVAVVAALLHPDRQGSSIFRGWKHARSAPAAIAALCTSQHSSGELRKYPPTLRLDMLKSCLFGLSMLSQQITWMQFS